VRRDTAHARIDRERDLDHLVQRRFIAGRAERAHIFVLPDGLERCVGIEHTATTRTEHIPGKVEEAKTCSVEQCRYGAFFTEAVPGGKGQGHQRHDGRA
jgi:hypothetical protein